MPPPSPPPPVLPPPTPPGPPLSPQYGATTTTAQVLVLRDPRSMDLANQANVLRAIQEMTPVTQRFA